MYFLVIFPSGCFAFAEVWWNGGQGCCDIMWSNDITGGVKNLNKLGRGVGQTLERELCLERSLWMERSGMALYWRARFSSFHYHPRWNHFSDSFMCSWNGNPRIVFQKQLSLYSKANVNIENFFCGYSLKVLCNIKQYTTLKYFKYSENSLIEEVSQI